MCLMGGNKREWRLWWVRAFRRGKGGFDLCGVNRGCVLVSYFTRSRLQGVIGKHGRWWLGGCARGGSPGFTEKRYCRRWKG